MAITITKRNDKAESSSERFVTGLTSFDWAWADNLGNKGLHLRSIVELAGDKGVGKSTMMFSLAGMLAANLHRELLLLDFERQNETTVTSCLELAGCDESNPLQWESYEWETESKKKKPRTSNQTMDISTKRCYETPPPIVMIDSLAAWKPEAVFEGDLGDSNMGIKARITRQWFDRTLRPLISNPYPNVVFFTNHKLPDIGGFRPSPNAPIPTSSSGGTAVGYLATQSVTLKKLFGFDYPDYGGYVLEGKVDKNRDGFGKESKKNFYVFIQAGEGISKNLTAVIDCFMYGLAKSSATKITDSSTITIGDNTVGKFRDLIENRHDQELFIPFHNALKTIKGGIQESDGSLGVKE